MAGRRTFRILTSSQQSGIFKKKKKKAMQLNYELHTLHITSSLYWLDYCGMQAQVDATFITNE